MTLDQVVKTYGPFRLIDRRREHALLDADQWQRLLTVIEGDSGELCACIGHHLVNVVDIYEATSPMPEDLFLDEVWYGDTGLPSP